MTSSMPNVNKRVRSRRRFSLPWRTSFLLFLACIVVAGCGQRGVPPRFQVQGTVTFKGRPVPSGTIRFEPDGSRGNQGPVSVIPIREGHYRSDQPGVKGSIKGPLVVWISGYPARDPNVEIQPPLFPEYRTTVDMVPQGTTTTLDFEVSDPTTSK
jgi:hypothetical protein